MIVGRVCAALEGGPRVPKQTFAVANQARIMLHPADTCTGKQPEALVMHARGKSGLLLAIWCTRVLLSRVIFFFIPTDSRGRWNAEVTTSRIYEFLFSRSKKKKNCFSILYSFDIPRHRNRGTLFFIFWVLLHGYEVAGFEPNRQPDYPCPTSLSSKHDGEIIFDKALADSGSWPIRLVKHAAHVYTRTQYFFKVLFAHTHWLDWKFIRRKRFFAMGHECDAPGAWTRKNFNLLF